MSDDIVTRLRDRAEERQEALDEYWRGHKFDYDFPMLESQAADEIERLRAGFRLMAKAYLQDLGMDRHGWNPDELCAEFVSKAVRDE